MESALLLNDLSQLAGYGEPFDRLYFGHEFCQRLFPTAGALSEAQRRAAELGKPLTVVTPFVTNAGLALLKERLPRLLATPPAGLEIVVNDWGVLNWLHREHPGVPLLLGRLLTKQKRGPRILHVAETLPAPAMAHFRASNVDVPHVARFLAGRGVVRVELDNLLQGLDRPPEGLTASLYHPYAYVSTTRLCLLAGGDRPDKNLRSIGRCGHECAHYRVTLRHEDMPVPLLLRGNTQYFRHERLPDNLHALGVTRLVYTPEPM